MKRGFWRGGGRCLAFKPKSEEAKEGAGLGSPEKSDGAGQGGGESQRIASLRGEGDGEVPEALQGRPGGHRRPHRSVSTVRSH